MDRLTYTNLLAATASQQEPAQEISTGPLLLAATLILLLVAIILIFLLLVLSKPSHKTKEKTRTGLHSQGSRRDVWLKKINQVVEDFEAGSLTRDQAFTQLAQAARDFASTASGTDVSTQTLTELNQGPRGSNRQGQDLLRQTIAALYPPEFADEQFNAAARETSVAQAAEWVSSLVERWR
ncbi:hypothetical protein CRD60_00660 [Bifidobacterium aemilianum]|uniref:Uncharacterized protein n=1 Tax=Bifidobacterium aemilianum TaxID=2493120 RepID=A0A366KBB6_9BIFI|nr:hypothetical protein [Bifidobacterium aemilianum]RBP98413.1 hypothetical protein CRD60_00660 [Bifidobacterium aemilianum]